MSWEIDSERDNPCPCGNGHYTVTSRSNDWGQHDETWTMHCPECKKTHGLFKHIYMHIGIHESYPMWVPKRDLRELEDLDKTLQKQKDEIRAYLENRYHERWAWHFDGKCKKEAWAELTEDGECYPQLSTFYSHVRSYGMERVLKEYLRYEKVDVVTRILRLEDSDLAKSVSLGRDLEGEITAKKDAIRRRGVDRLDTR